MSSHLPWPKSRFNIGFYLKSHVSNFRTAFAFFGRRFFFSVGVSLLLGIAMVLPASLWLFYKNLVNIDQEWSGQPGLVVYLEIHANDGEIKRTLEELQSLKDLRDLYIVPADQALKRFGY